MAFPGWKGAASAAQISGDGDHFLADYTNEESGRGRMELKIDDNGSTFLGSWKAIEGSDGGPLMGHK